MPHPYNPIPGRVALAPLPSHGSMSGARRSSRIKALPPQNLADEAVEDEDEAISTSMTKRQKRGRDVTNEDSDWKRPRKKKTQMRGGAGKLSLLPNMPLDILFEICSYLPPKSLMALIDVNKAFRETLARPVWTTLRKEFEAPDPPSGTDTSEIDWMRLLFGDTMCYVGHVQRLASVQSYKSLIQVCDAKRVTLNWVLRKRICNKCISTQGVSARGFVKAYGVGLDKTSRDLVLSLIWPAYGIGTHYYPFEEIDQVLEGLRISRGKGSEEADKYVAERKAHLVKLREHVKLCKEWMKAETMKKFKSTQQLRQERFDAVKTRLLAMGFTQQDAAEVRDLDGVRRESPLTERSWIMIKAEVLREIYLCRTMQMLHTNTPAFQARCAIVSRLYTELLKTLTPTERQGFPNIECPECLENPGTLKDAFRHIFGTFCTLPYARRQLLLELRMRVGSRTAATSLVDISGLDPLRASADEMDEKGLWYRCLLCNFDEAFVGMWRECVNHFHVNSGSHGIRARSHEGNIFEILETERMDDRLCWSCSHCHAHIEEPASRIATIEHIKAEHHVEEPMIPRDFLFVGSRE
uniref:F-box domain-containing protein n=1 Tax=Moniliophthora roreri TaxID=221103 RepID=A0A0W0FVW2_MONRR